MWSRPVLARLTAGQSRAARPVFLFCGQRAIPNQAATRYLARNHERPARKHGNHSFALLLKVVNSQAYGPDVVEVVTDITRAAQTPAPAASAPTSHRACDRPRRTWRASKPRRAAPSSRTSATWARSASASWSAWSTCSASSTTRPVQLTSCSPEHDPSWVSIPLREQ